MIICANCNSENPNGSVFCGSCGNRMDVVAPPAAGPVCPGCGRGVTSATKFCPGCGFNIVAGAAIVPDVLPPQMEEDASEEYEKTELLMDVASEAESQPDPMTELLMTPAIDMPEAEEIEEPSYEPAYEPEPEAEAIEEPSYEPAYEPEVAAEPEVEPVAEPVIEPVAEPEYEATEMLSDIPAEPVAEPVYEAATEPEVDPLANYEPIDVAPANNQPAYEATELLTEAQAAPVPQYDPLSAQAPVNNQPAYEATELLTEAQPQYDALASYDVVPEPTADIPAFIPPVDIGSNGEDYNKYVPEYSEPYLPDEEETGKKGKKSKKAKKEKKAKKKGKGIIVLIVVLVILLALAGGGYFAYTQGYLDEPIDTVKEFVSDKLGLGSKKDKNKDKDAEDGEEGEESDELNLDDIKMPDIPDQIYTGSPIVPSLNLKLGDEELVEGEDYDVTLTSNILAGTATITLTGKGDIKGSTSGDFKIIYGNEVLDNPANEARNNYITNLYVNLNGRYPTSAEIIGDQAAILGAGADFDYASYIMGFMSRPEYQAMVDNIQTASTVNEYLVRVVLYGTIMNVEADDAGVESWTAFADENGFEAAVQLLLSDANASVVVRANLGI